MAVSKPLAGTQIDRTAPAAQGVLAAWAFNEGGGTRVADSVSRANDSFGVAANLAWKNGGFFNGSSSSVLVPNKNFPFLKSTPFSGFAEVEWKSSGVIQCIFGTWVQSTSAGWMFYITSTGALRLIFTDAGGINYFFRDSTRTLDARRHTVGFTYDGSAANTGIKLFLDGAELAGSNTVNGTGDPGALAGTNLYIGRNASAASSVYWFNGSINGAALHGAKLDPMLARSVTSNLWQLWPDEPQLVFAPVTTFTGTATSSQAQTSAATGLAGNIGTATASQAQTTNATGLAGVIGTATSSQAQSATGAGAETYNGNATSSQAQTAAAVGLAGVIGTATASQAQTSDAIGVAGIVGTATSSQAQTVNGAGNNGQLSVQFGGHIAQPQYIHVPMFARGTGKATCKSRPHVRVLTRALAIGRSKGTCRPLARQFMAGRAVGASVPVISSMRLQYNETWHAQRARDDQSLLFGF